MASGFVTNLSDIQPGKELCCIRVRIIRLWGVRSTIKAEHPTSLEMVLIDEQGVKIHASVLKNSVHVHMKRLVEGNVYEICSFWIAPSSGSLRTTLHPFRIVLHLDSKVRTVASDLISEYGLTVMSSAEVSAHNMDYEYLIDMVGCMTGISSRQDYFVDGKICKVVILELTDQSGIVNCALFGDHVAKLKKYVFGRPHETPIVVLRFVGIKMFTGNPVVESVSCVTDILVNPDIPEVEFFRKGMMGSGFDCSIPLNVIDLKSNNSDEKEFLIMYPIINIAELSSTSLDGVFIVCGNVDYVEEDDWWFASCESRKILNRCSGARYCNSCVKHVFPLQPRFRVKLHISDGSGDVVFVLSDRQVCYLIEKHCSDFVHDAQGNCKIACPYELLSLKNRKILFKVQVKSLTTSMHLDSYDRFIVKRVCDDGKIMKSFLAARGGYFCQQDLITAGEDGGNGGEGEFARDF